MEIDGVPLYKVNKIKLDKELRECGYRLTPTFCLNCGNFTMRKCTQCGYEEKKGGDDMTLEAFAVFVVFALLFPTLLVLCAISWVGEWIAKRL